MTGILHTELSKRDEWMKKHIIGDDLPFSFFYGKRPSKELLTTWKREFSQITDRAAVASVSTDTSAGADGATRYTSRWSDPETGLEATCIAASFPDYPTIEWTLYLKNNGSADTPLIENILGLDISLEKPDDENFMLKTIRGDTCSPAAYEPIEIDLTNEQGYVKFAPIFGKPSAGAFPYFNIQAGDSGILIAIGWPGQWAASFYGPYWGRSTLYAEAGQEVTCLSLHPGEEIRAQLSVLMFWEGGYARSQNLWRRFMNDHNLPKPGGKLVEPFVWHWNSNYHHEETELQMMREYDEHGIHHDMWGVDAGWCAACTEESWWPCAGDWEVDKARFPSGMNFLSDEARARGMKFIMLLAAARQKHNIRRGGRPRLPVVQGGG